ncbi:unnamed protein product [Discosporangium mesarthrocarpum]
MSDPSRSCFGPPCAVLRSNSNPNPKVLDPPPVPVPGTASTSGSRANFPPGHGEGSQGLRVGVEDKVRDKVRGGLQPHGVLPHEMPKEEFRVRVRGSGEVGSAGLHLFLEEEFQLAVASVDACLGSGEEVQCLMEAYPWEAFPWEDRLGKESEESGQMGGSSLYGQGGQGDTVKRHGACEEEDLERGRREGKGLGVDWVGVAQLEEMRDEHARRLAGLLAACGDLAPFKVRLTSL